MATLEQELMADFMDSGDEDVQDLENDFAENDGEDEDMVDEEAEYRDKEKGKDKKGPADIRGAQKLMSEMLVPVLKRIEEVKDHMDIVEGESIEESPDYQLLKEANELSTQIDGEVAVVHKFVRDHYSQYFPSLEQLVQNPLSYAKAIRVIRSSPLSDIKRLSEELKTFLPPAQVMVVEIEATRVEGRLLEETELNVILSACSLMIDLDSAKDQLLSFVESRTSVFAPNLTELLGSVTAAQMINAAGGLSALSKTPSCNLAPLGSNKVAKTSIGLSNVGLRHEGYLFHAPILQYIRPEDKRQALRIVSAKVILAARVDAHSASRNNEIGIDLRKECERRLDKLVEVGKQAAGGRALPVPDDKLSRKRGGRRARKAKEATAQTEIRKAQNRMAFGKEEKEVGYGDSVKGMGMIGATDTGRLRAQQIDPKTRAKLSKKNPGWGGDTTLGAAASLKGFGAGGGTATSLRAQGLRTGGVGLGGAGTSSIAFTPVQGLELVDPKARDEMNRKRKAEEDRWFRGGSFTQLNGSSKVDAGGFKVPALPNKKPKTES